MKTQTTVNDMLRVGVIHQGHIVEDYLFKTKARITAGRSIRNGVSLPAASVPIRHKLVDTRGGHQHLCFEKGMLGKVYTDGEVIDLRTAARRRLAERKGDRFYLPLGPNVRASIVLGDATFLFQHVRAPASPLQSALPREARGRWWRNLDKPFLSVLALSLFAQGGFEAAQEMYWRDTGQYLVREKTGTPKLLQALVILDPKNQDPTMVPNIELAQNTEPAPIVEPSEPDLAVATVIEPADEISEGTDPAIDLEIPVGPIVPGADGTTQLVNAEEANIEFAAENPAIPAARPVKGAGGAPAVALGTELPTNGNLGAVTVLHSMFGTPSSTGIGVAGRDDPWDVDNRGITSYGGNDDPNVVWRTDSALVPTTALIEAQPSATALVNMLVNETAPKAPMPAIAQPGERLTVADTETPKARSIRVSVRGGKVGRTVGTGRLDSSAVRDEVRKRTPGLQRLYLDAVRKNPGIRGRIVVRITVGASGRSKVEIVSDLVMDEAFARALKRKISLWRFPKPKGGEVSFKVPFTFRSI